MRTQRPAIRAALYIRVSTTEQVMEGYSLAAQERVLTDYCQQKHYSVYAVYRDEGISAKDILHRPGILQLIDDSRKGLFDVVIVWKLTRFTRSLANLTTICEEFDRRGIDLISYSEAFDSRTPAGRMVRSMLGTVAQFEREVISENVSMGMLERARQGKRTCHDVLGYDLLGTDSFTINDAEAEYVNFVHDQYLIRKNLTEVAALARARGYHGRRGKCPTPYSVYIILTRPIYAGYNTYKGELYEGDYTPIRTVAQFNKVQRLLLKQGRITGRHRRRRIYILPED